MSVMSGRLRSLILSAYKKEQEKLGYLTHTGLAEVSGNSVLMAEVFTCIWKCSLLFLQVPFSSAIVQLPTLSRAPHSRRRLVLCQGRIDLL